MTPAYDIERVQVLCVEIKVAIAGAMKHFRNDDPALSCWRDALRAVTLLDHRITSDKMKKESKDTLKIDYATGGHE